MDGLPVTIRPSMRSSSWSGSSVGPIAGISSGIAPVPGDDGFDILGADAVEHELVTRLQAGGDPDERRAAWNYS